MENYFVYLLESEKDGNFYIGQTDNVEKRIARHKKGQIISTKNRLPIKLVGYIKVCSRSKALQMDNEFKKHSDKKLKFIKQFRPDFNWRSKPR